MSFGLSLGDLKSACELGFLIYERCFTKAERAGKSNFSVMMRRKPLFLRSLRATLQKQTILSFLFAIKRVVNNGLTYTLNRCQVPAIWQGHPIPHQEPTTVGRRN